MKENIEVTESDTVEKELEDGLGFLSLENPMSDLNKEEIKEWLDTDFEEWSERISTDEALYQSTINLTAPKDVDFGEDDTYETNNTSCPVGIKQLMPG